MTEIIYSDENSRLTDEICSLFMRAANETLKTEFGEELEALSVSLGNAKVEIGVTIAEDDEIRELNKDYRDNDKVTDVLSFPQYEGHDDLLTDLSGRGKDDEETAILIGDVVICYEQAMRQAEEYGTGETREIVYLFVHSIMHLFGYDHMDEEERRVMRAREEEVLNAIGI